MSEQPTDERQELVRKALALHRAQMDEAARGTDVDVIKKSYMQLGDLLEEALHDSDVDRTPVFSYPEIGPVVASLAATSRGRILDAGCGPYPIHSVLLGNDPSRWIVAMDISESMVRLAVDRARRLGLTFPGVVGDVEALPFRDGAFDACVCGDTIEHVPDDRTAVVELARIIRRGGRLFLATPNRVRLDVLRRRLADLRRGIRRGPRDYFEASSHLREYSWGDVRRLVRRRFRVRGAASVGWTGGRRSKLATLLVRYWPLRLVSRVVVYELEPR